MTSRIRVRFAPSPTGFLHVGGLRTALYNYLFAKHHQGKMVLRIEDTDRTRYIDGAIDNLLNTLKQMNIDYDEGPDKSGEFGPYIQSERIEIYRRFAQKLVEEENGYYCFCSPSDLERMRRRQEQAKSSVIKYDGTCRNLSEKEINEKLDSKLPYVFRLKMPLEGDTVFHDLIRGEVKFSNEQMDDQILLKTDGFPTYHLANVIDDHLMEISHVIRGEEWLPSVPKHLRLYEAFGWELPQLAHLPLLLNPDRSKLSKRQGDVAVEEFLKKGYLPPALINFVALLGWNPGDDREIFSLQKLVEEFSLERVNKAGAVFDLKKLDWMNGQYIRQLQEEEREKFLRPFLEEAGFDISDGERVKKIITAVHKRLEKGSDIVDHAALFYSDKIEITESEALDVIRKPTAQSVLISLLSKIESLPEINLQIFQKIMKEVQEETGIKKQDLWMPVRVALSGVTHGPDLPLLIEILGKKKIQKFIKQILNQF